MGDFSENMVKALWKEVMEYILSNHEQLKVKVLEDWQLQNNKTEKKELIATIQQKIEKGLKILNKEQLEELQEILKSRFDIQ